MSLFSLSDVEVESIMKKIKLCILCRANKQESCQLTLWERVQVTVLRIHAHH